MHSRLRKDDLSATENLPHASSTFDFAYQRHRASSDYERQLFREVYFEAVHGDRIEGSIEADGLASVLDISPDGAASQGDRFPLDVPTIVVQRGKQIRLTILSDTEADAGRRDRKLIELVVWAHDAARRLGLLGDRPVAETSEPEKARLFRIARFAFLAPDITSAILEGRQPATLQTRRLLRIAAMPACWSEQRRMLGFR